MAVKGKIRRGRTGPNGAVQHQFVVFDDKTGKTLDTGGWEKDEKTAQTKLDKALESTKKKSEPKGKAAEKKAEEKADKPDTPDAPLRDEGAADVPPGGQNTGPRG